MSAPLFTTSELSASASAAVAQRGTPATLNLDDIFGDVLFTPDGETIFLSDQQGDDDDAVMASGEGDQIANHASRVTDDGNVIAVPNAGGIVTTQLDQDGKPSLVMGAADGVHVGPAVPFQQAPQQRHHLQYATPQMAAAMKKRKGAASKSERKMSEQQKVERRYVDSLSLQSCQ